VDSGGAATQLSDHSEEVFRSGSKEGKGLNGGLLLGTALSFRSGVWTRLIRRRNIEDLKRLSGIGLDDLC